VIPVPPAVYRLLVAALLAGGLFGSGWWIGRDGAQDKAREAALVAKAEAEEVRRAVENAWGVALYKLAYSAEEQRIERERETESTIADLRSGAIRLRYRFTCPKLPRDPAPAGQPEPADTYGLRTEDAEFLVRFADERDQIADERNQCIASYNALRQ
jgi:hypothetical protein